MQPCAVDGCLNHLYGGAGLNPGEGFHCATRCRGETAKAPIRAAATQVARHGQGTTLTYPDSAGARGKADALAVAKVFRISVTDVKSSPDADTVTLTIGADWKDGTDYGRTLPKPGSVPDDADVVHGADTRDRMDVEPVYRW